MRLLLFPPLRVVSFWNSLNRAVEAESLNNFKETVGVQTNGDSYMEHRTVQHRKGPSAHNIHAGHVVKLNNLLCPYMVHGINSILIVCIKNWLTDGRKRVVMDGRY